MKSLLLTVTLFVLVAVLQAQDDLPFLSEEKKIAGVWFEKATVSNGNMSKLEKPLVLFPYILSYLEQGILEVKTTVMYEGQCIKTAMHMKKTEEPGQYSSFSGHKLLYIYELPVKDHYIIYIETLLYEKKFLSGHLIGKCPRENMEALEEFKTFSQHKGLLQENIIVPQQRAHCVPKHDRGLAALDGADIAKALCLLSGGGSKRTPDPNNNNIQPNDGHRFGHERWPGGVWPVQLVAIKGVL
ncbi:vomeronasal secretory protein 2-like [Onychomys torridus]|uniref:vomeronasal secretory protein 2-like n=1 Tax=Onychomys torridus TaxID=38674 RepID=UPI00167F3873|nr:vomeronasal secretory protein 2-like [Onychomys torridus]